MRVKAIGIAAVLVLASLAHGGPDTITYQGSLLNPLGGPVTNGTYQMQFKLYDAASGGTNRWQETDNVEVTRGLFATTLGDSTPFGGLFLSYADLWLEVTIDTDRSGTFEGSEVFSPRQNLTGVPWACPRLEPNSTSPNVIGGYSGNSVTAGVYGATIGGGGGGSGSNLVTDIHGTVSGGYNNQAGDNAGTTEDARMATVGGGVSNTASDSYATVGGGGWNTASGPWATVGGGDSNTASGWWATVSGGSENTASGYCATIPGGLGNLATTYSLAAGQQAKANHQGSFVWADSTSADFASERDNQFRVRANGGVRFDVNNNRWVQIYDDGTNLIDTIVGARLTLAGAWADVSDRNRKENIVRADGREVLEKLADVPICTWNHKAEDPSIRHMGPMAQDLYAAFGLGDSDESITTIDADGVALAAIQGLYQILQEKDAEIAALAAEKAAEQRRIANLETRLAALEAQVATLAQRQSAAGD